MELLEGTMTVEDLDAVLSTISKIGEEYGVTVQAFDARYVADRTHLERAVELADRAIERGENVARDRAVEICCYAAGRRQIDRALDMGVAEGTQPAVVLVAAGQDGTATKSNSSQETAAVEAAATEALTNALDIEAEPVLSDRDDDWLATFFEISDRERGATTATLAALVHERVALLDVEK